MAGALSAAGKLGRCRSRDRPRLHSNFWRRKPIWDLDKTMNHVAGVRRRIAKGLPPYTMTPEERQQMRQFREECEEARANRKED